MTDTYRSSHFIFPISFQIYKTGKFADITPYNLFKKNYSYPNIMMTASVSSLKIENSMNNIM